MPIQSKQQPPYYTTKANVKIYIALITQTGTNDPTVKILVNTYEETPEPGYVSTGAYALNAILPIFTQNKTTIQINPSFTDLWTIGTWQSETVMRIETYTSNGDGTSALSNGNLSDTLLIIQTHP